MKWNDLPLRYKGSEIGFVLGAICGTADMVYQLLMGSNYELERYPASIAAGTIIGYSMGGLVDIINFIGKEESISRTTEPTE